MRQQISWMVVLSLIAIVPRASAETGNTIPTVEAIIARMAQARDENESRLRPYIVRRGYTLFGQERQQSKSEVMADRSEEHTSELQSQ